MNRYVLEQQCKLCARHAHHSITLRSGSCHPPANLFENEPMTIDNIDLFISVCEKPGICVQSNRYETVCAFIDGYDRALQGAPLIGFRQWLLSESNEWNNLPWDYIVRTLRYPDRNPTGLLSEAESSLLLSDLVSHLMNYQELRNKGLELVYQKHINWLISRSDSATAEFRERLSKVP